MRAVEGVLDVHDLHIWSLGIEHPRAELPRADRGRSAVRQRLILRRLNGVLADRFHISHTTVQFEHVSCAISRDRLRDPGPHPRSRRASLTTH